mgnify:CR=1 FL=1
MREQSILNSNGDIGFVFILFLLFVSLLLFPMKTPNAWQENR